MSVPQHEVTSVLVVDAVLVAVAAAGRGIADVHKLLVVSLLLSLDVDHISHEFFPNV